MLGMLLLFDCSAKHRCKKIKYFLVCKHTALQSFASWCTDFTWKLVLARILERIKTLRRITQIIQRTLKKPHALNLLCSQLPGYFRQYSQVLFQQKKHMNFAITYIWERKSVRERIPTFSLWSWWSCPLLNAIQVEDMVTILTAPHRGYYSDHFTAYHALVLLCCQLFNQRPCK